MSTSNGTHPKQQQDNIRLQFNEEQNTIKTNDNHSQKHLQYGEIKIKQYKWWTSGSISDLRNLPASSSINQAKRRPSKNENWPHDGKGGLACWLAGSQKWQYSSAFEYISIEPIAMSMKIFTKNWLDFRLEHMLAVRRIAYSIALRIVLYPFKFYSFSHWCDKVFIKKMRLSNVFMCCMWNNTFARCVWCIQRTSFPRIHFFGTIYERKRKGAKREKTEATE